MSTILIVDDNPGHLALLSDVLQAEGHTTQAAESGEQAIELALSTTPDLILMDIQIGDMGGVEALSVLRQNPATRAVPIIAVTALAMDGDKERLLAAGFDDYLSKPVDLAVVRKIVQRFLSSAEDGRT
ncbi:MAG: response regulator [Actinomycetota bacterium]|nr:response regulator [Actinomycetota bacterium]